MDTATTRPSMGPAPTPAKCRAHSTRTGQPCGKRPISGATVCQTHGGAAPQVKRKAAERLALLADTAVDLLGRILRDEEQSAADRIRAAVAVLDRAGYPAGLRVEHSGETAVHHSYGVDIEAV